MRGLKICLWIAGIGCLLAGIALFLPISALDSMVKLFSEESLPSSAVSFYLLRLILATYFGIGLFYIILAREPVKYGMMIPFSGIIAVFIGVVCAVAGLVYEMPVLWFLGDATPSIVLGVLIFIFWQKAKFTA
jgi:hypothetical protein